jgi:APA family basic amino acid/polyamine antiporter
MLAIFKVLFVAGIGISAFILASGDWMNFSLSGASGTCEGVAEAARGGFAGFAAAMLGALAAYNGWQSIVYLAGEVKNPSRNIPVALIGGVLAVIALYLFVNAAYFSILTPVEVASVPTNSSVATAVVAKFLGPLSSKFIAAAILLSVLGMVQIASMRLARSVYAMSRDGLFLDPLGEVSPKTHVPVRAIVVQGLWAMVIIFFGSYDTLTDYQNFVLWIFFGLAGASILVLRRKMPQLERPYRTLGYPLVPILFLAVTAWLLVNTMLTNPTRSLIGIGLIALGLPIYWYRRRRIDGDASGVRADDIEIP